MARQIEWTRTAWNDLAQVADYIAQDSPGYASAFVREVRDAARSLDEFSERGRIVPEFNDNKLRELFVRHYRLIYKITPHIIYVVGFIHGGRDLRPLWKREKRSI